MFQRNFISWLFCGFHPFLGDKCFRLATTAATTIHVFQQMAGRASHLVAGSNLSWTASSFKRSLLKKMSLVSNCGKNWKKMKMIFFWNFERVVDETFLWENAPSFWP